MQVVTWTATQSFHVGGHRACRWCRSSYSIRILILKFVGLPAPKIWLTFDHGINWWVTLTFGPLNGVMGHTCHGFPSCQFSACYTLLLSTLDQAQDRQTWTDNGHQCIRLPGAKQQAAIVIQQRAQHWPQLMFIYVTAWNVVYRSLKSSVVQ